MSKDTDFSNKNSKLRYELFDPRIIALNQEVAQHPALQKILREQEVKDIYIALLEIATYCDILVVHDIYTKEDILELCDKMTKALYQKRTQVIIPLG
jgi:mannose/fructose/N-acetylgalactosamine-specific phosphotransferase system component IIB